MGLFDNKSSNPMFNDDVIDNFSGATTDRMTVQGTINKTLILLAITVATAALSWRFMASFGSSLYFILFGVAIGAAGLAFYTYKNPKVANVTAPIFAVMEGLFIGVISMAYAYMVEGIIMKAALLTFGTMFIMLFIYKSKLIVVTDRFRMILSMAIGAIGLMYLASWILGMFDVNMPFLHDSSPLSIGISLVIIVVASLSFLMDFDMIEKNAERGVSKNYEWVGGMALLMTIVWLYLEFLRLLSKLQD